MNYLKTTLFTLLFSLLAISSYAQPGGGGMGGPGGGMGGPGGGMGGPGGGMGGSSVSIDLLTSTGYFEIDAEKAIKKIKISKKDQATKDAVNDVIVAYLLGYDDVTILHQSDIEFLDALNEAMASGEGMGGGQMGGGQGMGRGQMGGGQGMGRGQMGGGQSQQGQGGRQSSGEGQRGGKMQGVFEKSGPIREKMEALHTELCDQMEGLLNEKQLKKWNKFYDSLCEDNGFVVGGAPFPAARNNSSRNSMGGNMMMDDMGMGGGDMW